MASKWKGGYDNGRKYSKAWESKFSWVTKALDGSNDAFCNLCHSTVKPKLCNLTKHEGSVKHMRHVKLSTTMKPIQVIRVPKAADEVKIAEIELAVTMACHSAMMTMDHLGEVIVRNANGSKLENLKMHRKKCTKILTNVVSPAMKEELIADVQGKRFSLIVDESTDVSTTKQLCVIIRYFSQVEKTILTAFVDLIPVVHTTADDLFNAIRNCLNEINLDLANCVGYASDGASVMVGEHDSVWTRIAAVSPQCIKMTCICHSLSLCVMHAFEKLPSSLGFLLAEVPKWFSKSSVRREAYKELFEVMCPDECRKAPFEKYSTTRWLVRGKVIYRILVNWNELKAYFLVAQPASTQAARYKARLLLNILNDPITYLYFHFVSPLVTEFDRVNAFFQATDADPEEMYTELSSHYKSLRARVFDPEGRPLPIEKVDFGGKFLFEATKYASSVQHDKAAAQAKILEVKKRCLDFLLEAVCQVEKRLPAAHNIFKGLSALHPSKVLNARTRVPFSQLPLPHLQQENSNAIEEQFCTAIGKTIQSSMAPFLKQRWHSGLRLYSSKLPSATNRSKS